MERKPFYTVSCSLHTLLLIGKQKTTGGEPWKRDSKKPTDLKMGILPLRKSQESIPDQFF